MDATDLCFIKQNLDAAVCLAAWQYALYDGIHIPGHSWRSVGALSSALTLYGWFIFEFGVSFIHHLPSPLVLFWQCCTLSLLTFYGLPGLVFVFLSGLALAR